MVQMMKRVPLISGRTPGWGNWKTSQRKLLAMWRKTSSHLNPHCMDKVTARRKNWSVLKAARIIINKLLQRTLNIKERLPSVVLRSFKIIPMNSTRRQILRTQLLLLSQITIRTQNIKVKELCAWMMNLC